jgi:hypothetical protein
MSVLTDLLSAFNQEPSIHFSDVLRALVTHETWWIPSRDGQPILNQRDDETHLNLYSSSDITEGIAQAGIEFIEQSTHWVFSNIPNVASIIIDAHTEHALQIPNVYISNLLRMYQALGLENHLSTMTEANWMTPIRDFQHYLLPLVEDEQGRLHMALAPDQQQRALVAVFTAEDAAQRFLQAAGDRLGKIHMDLIDGEKLFTQLNLLPLEGLVFNCYGPVATLALNKETIHQLATV